MTPADRYDSLFTFYAAMDHDRTDPLRRRFVVRPVPLDWSLLKRQAMAESGGDPDAISPVGAKGLTQFMDATWREWAENEYGDAMSPRRYVSPFDPEDAIAAQADVMAWLLKVWEGDVRKALASYNAGIGRVTKLVKTHGEAWEQHVPKETRGYVAKILGA